MKSICIALLLAFATALHAAEAKDLAGLWEAKNRFGPDFRGTLTLRHEGAEWIADLAGRTIAARDDHGTITFALPDGDGSFRGRVASGGKELVGSWRQPNTVRGGAFATPVRLTPIAGGGWRGEVTPLDDTFTHYIRINPDHSAFLRNPERNLGRFWDLARITMEGNVLKLFNTHGDEVVRGTYDADNDEFTLPMRGGAFTFFRTTDQSGFYPRGKTPAPYVYRRPLARNDGWPTATLEDVNLDRAQIEKFVRMLIATPIDSVHTPEIHGVLIARHGKLVLEEYFHNEHRDKLHDTRSAAKSLTATLIGAAMESGVPIALSTPVYEAMDFPADDGRKKAMTLEHLLTMSSGLYCDDGDDKAPGNEDTMQQQRKEPDWYRYALNVPMAMAPGEKAIYCSTNPNLAGGMLQHIAHEPLPQLFDRLVARPMQFGNYALFLSPTGDAYMGGGSYFLPRDFMKLAQLMLNGGTWNGRRILGRSFVERASSPRVTIDKRNYGYLWWIEDYPYRDHKVLAFFAGGNGGQIAMAIPELDLAIAFYGGNYSDATLFTAQNVYVPQWVLPAVK